jgi:hypothetical protein
MPKLYTGIVDPRSIPQDIKDSVKNFILRASRNEEARFPSNQMCYIWYDGKPLRVQRGSYYEKSGSDIILDHNLSYEIPEWLPAVLSAVAQFFGIGNDPEITQAIISMALQISAGIFESLTANLAQTFGGLQLTHLAVNSKENLLAGEYPPEVEGEPSVWRLAISGEIVNVEGPDWTAFTLQS